MPIFFRQDADEETLDCHVPILSIQTFVENSIKYARKKGQVLSIQVRVRKKEKEGSPFLSIRITDNGSGYPDNRLEELNAPVNKFCYNSRQVGIDNIKYRIYLMYGENAQLFFYNSLSGGAVTELLLPEGLSDESSYN